MLQAQNFGNSLHEVLRLKKRHQNLCKEIEGHEPIITALCVTGDQMVNDEHPKQTEVDQLKSGLVEHLDNLKVLSQNYQAKLDESLLARQVTAFFKKLFLQTFLAMVCDRTCTPWHTPSLSKECNRLHVLSLQIHQGLV